MPHYYSPAESGSQMPWGEDSDTELVFIHIGVIQPENTTGQTTCPHELLEASTGFRLTLFFFPHFYKVYLYPVFKGMK